MKWGKGEPELTSQLTMIFSNVNCTSPNHRRLYTLYSTPTAASAAAPSLPAPVAPEAPDNTPSSGACESGADRPVACVRTVSISIRVPSADPCPTAATLSPTPLSLSLPLLAVFFSVSLPSDPLSFCHGRDWRLAMASLPSVSPGSRDFVSPAVVDKRGFSSVLASRAMLSF